MGSFLSVPPGLLALLIAGVVLLAARRTRRAGAAVFGAAALGGLLSIGTLPFLAWVLGFVTDDLEASQGYWLVGGLLMAPPVFGVVGVALGAWLGLRLTRPKPAGAAQAGPTPQGGVG